MMRYSKDRICSELKLPDLNALTCSLNPLVAFLSLANVLSKFSNNRPASGLTLWKYSAVDKLDRCPHRLIEKT